MTLRTLLFSIISLLFSFSTSAAFFITPEPPKVDAASYVLMDFNSGEIISSKNPDVRREPASLTKLMTAYVTFKRLEDKFITLEDEVRISKKAWKTGGSRSFVKVGTDIKLETLLKGVIIQSGNDASVALAEHIAGSEGTFVSLMNQYASALGMANTNFENASGLPHENQFSSSYDIALLSAAIIREFPEYYKWFSQKEFIHNNIKQLNRNGLLRSDKTVDGLKTGHTNKAGYCLAVSANRVDMRLISVVMGAANVSAREKYSRSLLDYGFRFYETKQIKLPKEEVQVYKGKKNMTTIGAQKPIYLTLERGKFKFLEQKISFNRLIAPITKGQTVGSVEVIFNQKETGEQEVITTVPLVAKEDIEAGGMIGNIIDSIKLMF